MHWFLFAFFQTHTVVILTLNQSSIVQSDRSSLFHPSIFFIIYCIVFFFPLRLHFPSLFSFFFLFPVYFSLLFSSLFPFPFPFPFRFCFRFLFLHDNSSRSFSFRYLFNILFLHDISSISFSFTITLQDLFPSDISSISFTSTISLQDLFPSDISSIFFPSDISSISFNRLSFSLLSVKAVLLKKFAFPCLLTICSIHCSASVLFCSSSAGIQIQLVLF